MKKTILTLFFAVLLGAAAIAQNTNPTIGSANGQYFCLTANTFNLVVSINLNGYSGMVFNYTIDWGDGSPLQTVANPAPATILHIYNFAGSFNTCDYEFVKTIKLKTYRVANDPEPLNNNFDATFRNPPKASFTATPQPGCAGNSIFFNAECSPNSGSTTPPPYSWQFGDGATGTGRNTTHIYSTANSYTVTMTASNPCGAQSTTRVVQVITPPAAAVRADSGVVAGGAGTTANPYIVCRSGGGKVRIDGTLSTNETSYTWSNPNFSGYTFNGSRTQSITRVTFPSAGTYTVQLSVDNPCNQPSTAEAVFSVIDATSLSLTAEPDNCQTFNYTPSPVIAGATYTINGAAATFPYSASVSANPYIVVATLSNACGAQTVRDTFRVANAVAVTVTPSSSPTVCAGAAAIPLTGTPAGGFWSGDTNFLTNLTNNTTFNPTTAGRYTVTYTVGVGACARSGSFAITVAPQPVLTLTPQADDCVSISYTPQPFNSSATYQVDGAAAATFPLTLGVGSHTVAATLTGVCATQTRLDTFVVAPQTPLVVRSPQAADTSVCVGSLPLTLVATPSGGTWSGAGVVGNVFTVPAAAGDYPLVYTVGTSNCRQTATRTIKVQGASATAQDVTACSYNSSVALVGAPSGGVWTSSGCPTCIVGNTFNIAALPPNINTIPITYTFTNPIGCNAVGNATVTILSPVAAFNIGTACSGQPLVATSNAQNATAEIWRIDGVTTATPPPFAPVSSGAHTLQQVAVSGGCRDSIGRVFNVIAAPMPSFTTNKVEGCAPLSITFGNTSNGDALRYTWDYGDGTPIDTVPSPPRHIFRQGECDTTYTVRLTTRNTCDTVVALRNILVHPKPVPRFDVSADIICSGDSINFIEATLACNGVQSYRWDFGDGTTSTAVLPPAHRYLAYNTIRTFVISRTGTNACGDSTMTRIVTVKPINFRSFIGVDNALGCAPLTVAFRDTVRPSAQSFIHSWNFGDGSTSRAASPNHVFLQDGIFTVRHWVSSGCGWTDTTIQITVLPQPKVSVATPRDTCAGKPYRFVNTSEAAAIAFRWSFDDGANSTAISPYHAFANAGTHGFQLIGASVNGCTDTVQGTVNARPNPLFSIAPSSSFTGCAPLLANLSATLAPAGSVYFYSWQFGDGGTATGSTVSHIYARKDSVRHYYPTLRVTDAYGCIADSTFRYGIHTFPTPTAGFAVSVLPNCGLNALATFTNLSTGAMDYQWTFGDGATASDASPTHLYASSSGSLVLLTVKNTYECTDTMAMRLPYCDGLYIPSAFSPTNGTSSGTQLFGAVGLGIKQYRLQVFSRWGDLMWSTDKLQDGIPTERWDGNYNGSPAPQDVYVWKCEAVFDNGNVWRGMEDRAGALKQTGTVTLLR